jgi:hypothetical protein
VSRWFAAHLDETTLRLLALDPDGADAAASTHLAACVRCQSRAAAAAHALDGLRSDGRAAADLAFSAADLERQRKTIAARIVRGLRPARVLSFPHHEPGLPSRRADRRWLAAAAAAGLVLGALAGQLPHLRGPLVPAGSASADSGSAPPAVVAARTDIRPLEDTLLSEVEDALDSEARPALRALDALTPVHYEIR